jgi:hypothetical protein
VYLGRYKTILLFSLVCLAGHIVLVGTASPSSLEHSDGALAGLVVAIVIMGIGAGSIKSNVSPMIAEQYTGKLRKETLKSGEVVIKSPALTYQSIYNRMSIHTFYQHTVLTSCSLLHGNQLWLSRRYFCVIPSSRPRVLEGVPCPNCHFRPRPSGTRNRQEQLRQNSSSWFNSC